MEMIFSMNIESLFKNKLFLLDVLNKNNHLCDKIIDSIKYFSVRGYFYRNFHFIITSLVYKTTHRFQNSTKASIDQTDEYYHAHVVSENIIDELD